MTQDIVCSQFARDLAVQRMGSAQTVRLWLLIEYPRAWGAKAVEDFWRDEFPAADTTRLSAHPDARTLLIKRAEKPSDDFAVFVAVADELAPRLYALRLRSYADLLALDPGAFLAGDPALEPQRRSVPLFLTCTNGKRDQCCARYGVALHNALRAAAGDAAWQCTHVTLHRFAATGICFPHGLFYGQVEPSEAQALVEHYTRGAMYTERARGRACYGREAQVAEIFLREQTGVRALDAFRLLDVRAVEETRYQARFMSQADRRTHVVEFSAVPSAWETYASCDAAAPRRDTVYTLLRCTAGEEAQEIP